MNIRLTEPHWHNGSVCWAEKKQQDGNWQRCENSIGAKANKLHDESGELQGGRGYRGLRRTCWNHKESEAEAQALPLRTES